MPRFDARLSLQQLAATSRFFDAGAPVIYAMAHGCLDVLGALEAEGGGTLAQMILPGEIAVAIQPRIDGILQIRSAQIAVPIGDSEVNIVTASFVALSKPDAAIHIAGINKSAAWANGIVALAWLLSRELAFSDRVIAGANILIHGNLPMGAGQASSTALLAAVARGLAEICRLAPDMLTLAHWIATAESLAGAAHPSTPPPASRGHIIDAMTCLHLREPRPALLRYSAQPYRFVGPVPLPENVRVFALDTGVRYNSTRATLDELRIAAAMGLRIIDTIYRDLGQVHTPLHGYLTNTSPLLYRQYFRTLLPKRLRGVDFVRTYGALSERTSPLPPLSQEEVDTARVYRVRTAVDHIIAENEHAEQFLQAMEELADASNPGGSPMDEDERQRTLQRAGRLLLASHHSYRLRLELSCREADWLVDSLMESGPDQGVYGARITGCGGGGTLVALLDRSASATDALLRTMTSYQHLTGLTLGITEV